MTGKYREGWRIYRRWNRLNIVAFFGGVLLLRLGMNFGKVGTVIAFVTWSLAVVGTNYRIAFFKCPRCGHDFSGMLGSSRSCVHCGLKRYEGERSDGSDQELPVRGH